MGYQTILGDDGNNSLVGSNEDDLLASYAGNDNTQGGNGADILVGGTGDMIVDGCESRQNIGKPAMYEKCHILVVGYCVFEYLMQYMQTGSQFHHLRVMMREFQGSW